MASKALPLMAFLLIAMLLVSAVVDATETLDTETETSVDQSGYYPNRPYCRYRCCYRYRYYYRYGYRYRYYCRCCGKEQYEATTGKDD
ncbi:unnamed protein product [Spirodela intermedia]|uniref:Uncharacterized protein n=2 Tax=Spirodela intermedia TaxID=51605 RepID=A0A7I8JHH1_SPIIN|nr:unnamed protein product [Spirodela intermedia]CAA6669586.1 unnamed protein product [Spirodela intermedia]CAB1184565.1 unnamed protein product [Spirodela intermedia]